MRGEDRQPGSLFSYVDLEARVAADLVQRGIQTIRRALAARAPFERHPLNRLSAPVH
jgi:hypothetical protein